MIIAPLAALIFTTGVEGFSNRPVFLTRKKVLGYSKKSSHVVTPCSEQRGKCTKLRMALDIPMDKTKKDSIPSPLTPSPATTNLDHVYEGEPWVDSSQELSGRNNIIAAEGLGSISTEVKKPEREKTVIDEKPELSVPSVSDDESEVGFKAPGVAKIIKFAIPATGVWLCGPLLSLIDTAAVGLLAGTSHQAALSPAVAVTDYSALLLAFLYAATTNLVAASKVKSSSSDATGANVDKAPPQETLLSSLQLSLFVGAGLGAVLFTLSKVLLKALIGSDNINPAVFLPAVRYVKIRALGMPAAAVLGSAQAACLGLKDIRSPLMVLMSAAVINLMGDMIFVGCKHSLFHGAAGAAWATVFSQYAAVVFFLHWLKTKSGSDEGFSVGKSIRGLTARFSRGKKPSGDDSPLSKAGVNGDAKLVSKKREKAPKKATSKSFSTRGYLAEGNFRKRDIMSLPPKKAASKFLSYVIPVTTTSVGRVSLFLTMAHVVSSCMGTVGMAAQQIVLALFEALCPLADSMSLTAQSFIPLLHERAHESKENAGELTKATKDFFRAGSIFGGVIVSIVACIPLISRFFTKDLAVVANVNSIAPYLAGIFALHGVTMASEGVLLGSRDLGFLGKMYGVYFGIIPALMLRAKRAHQMGTAAMSLKTIWQIFLAYEASRVALWGGRALWLAHKKSAKAVGSDTTEESVPSPANEDGLTALDEAILFPLSGNEQHVDYKEEAFRGIAVAQA